MSELKHFLLWLAGRAGAETQTTEPERNCLAAFAQSKESLAEIGVWHGVTTSRIRASMSADGTLFAVDPFKPGRLGFSIPGFIAHRELSKVPRGNLVWIRNTGAEFATQISQKGVELDFVFVDGDHSYEGLKEDWLRLTPLLKTGGIIGLHDSQSSENRNIEDAGSVRYTREVVMNDSRFEVLRIIDSLTVLRRAVPGS